MGNSERTEVTYDPRDTSRSARRYFTSLQRETRDTPQAEEKDIVKEAQRRQRDTQPVDMGKLAEKVYEEMSSYEDDQSLEPFLPPINRGKKVDSKRWDHFIEGLTPQEKRRVSMPFRKARDGGLGTLGALRDVVEQGKLSDMKARKPAYGKVGPRFTPEEVTFLEKICRRLPPQN